jgi:hypothetical protein
MDQFGILIATLLSFLLRSTADDFHQSIEDYVAVRKGVVENPSTGIQQYCSDSGDTNSQPRFRHVKVLWRSGDGLVSPCAQLAHGVPWPPRYYWVRLAIPLPFFSDKTPFALETLIFR